MANRKGAKTGKGNVQKKQAQKKAEGAALRRLTEKAVQGVHEAAKAEAITVAATDVEEVEEDKKETTKKRPGRHARARRAKKTAASMKTAQETTVEPVLDTRLEALRIQRLQSQIDALVLKSTELSRKIDTATDQEKKPLWLDGLKKLDEKIAQLQTQLEERKQQFQKTSSLLNQGRKNMPTTPPSAAASTTPSAPAPATGGASGEAASVASVSSSPSTSTAQVTVTTPTPYTRPRWMEGRKPILSYSLDTTTQESTFLSKSIAEGYSKRIIDLSSELKEMLQKEGGEKQFFEGSSISNDQKKKAEYYKKRLEFAQKRLKLEEMKNLARKGRKTGGDYNNAKLELLQWEMMALAPAQASASAPALKQAAAQAPASAKTTSSEKKYQQAKENYEKFALRVSNSRLQKHLNKLLDLCNLSDDQKTPEVEKEAQSLLKKVKEDIELYNKIFSSTQSRQRGEEIMQTAASSREVLNNQDLKKALQTQRENLERRARSYPEEFLPAKPERASSNVSNEPTPYEQFVAAKVEEEVKAEMAKRNEKWDEKSSEEQYQIMKEAIRRRSKQQDMIEAFAKGGAKVQGAITKPGVCEYKVTGGKIVEKDGKNGVSYEIEGNVNSTIKVPRRNKDGSISTTSFDVLEIVNGEPHLHLSDDLTTTCRLDVKEMGKYIENQRNAKPVVIDHGQEVQVKSVGAISPSATPKASQGAAQGAARGT